MPEKNLTPLSSTRKKRQQKISAVDRMFFVQNLSVLIRAGFSLANALTTVAKQTKQKRLKEMIEDIAHSIESGQTFANALRDYSAVFDPLFINMIESGEISGKLEATLRELSVQLKKSHILFLKVRNALAYPVIILFAMLCVGTGMMVFVIPKIIDLYSGATQQLPLVTRGVIVLSDFVVNNGLLTLGLVLIISITSIVLYRQEPIKLTVHRVLLHLPVLGTIIQQFNLARFSRVLHSLITTDIPIVQAFHVISNTLGNRCYKHYVQSTITQLEKGVSIGEVLDKDPLLFPATVVQLMIVGEQSGTIDEMSQQMAEHYEQEVESTLDGLSVLIEPILMLFLGVGVGLIAVAVLWPMYNLVNVI